MAGAFRNLWDRSKDGSRHEQRTFIRVAVVATAIFFVIALVKHDGLVTWVRSGITLRKQERQMELLKKENAALEDRIKALSSDKDSLENFAREELLFAEPGDDVYIIGK